MKTNIYDFNMKRSNINTKQYANICYKNCDINILYSTGVIYFELYIHYKKSQIYEKKSIINKITQIY